ncbi:MAG TPA: ParB/RepB/Spo0J family partition protein [Gammaproteobacteria bacterium]|nr:ParB/RepB/Spo0J family partition protein [Gammaproteobacteria bacterium]
MIGPTAPNVITVPLDHITLGKNYRHRRPANWQQKLEELAASMKQNGQLEPVLGRPHPKSGGVELIFGERRYRAAKLAGLPELFVTVRDVPDEQVLELQLAENDDRDQPHPLDEAEAFAELVKRGATPASIAAIRGRTERYVRERLELNKLHAKVLTALDEGRILLGHALLIARIPEKLQPQALEDLERADEPLSLRLAGEHVQEHYMLKLVNAPFDRASAELVPNAGPCTTCPKRTGNQGELFADVKSPDVCTDPVCFRAKLDAQWKLEQKAAKAAGKTIIPAKDVQFSKWSARASSTKWEALDDTRYVGSQSAKIRTLVGKDAAVAIAQNPYSGAIVEFVSKAAVDAAVRRQQSKKAAKNGSSSSAREKVSPSEKARREKQKLESQSRLEIAERTLEAIADGCSKLAAGDVLAVLREAAAIAVMSNGSWSQVLERRTDKGVSYTKAPAALDGLLKGASLGTALGMLLEGLLGASIDYPPADEERRIATICKLLKVDRKKIASDVVTKLKAKLEQEKAEAKAAKTKGKKRGLAADLEEYERAAARELGSKGRKS